MSVEVQWTDTDPETGERRFVSVEKFARKWEFKVRARRRENWSRPARVTRQMWETLLDALERRYRRREGVTDEDLAAVRKVLAGLRTEEAAEDETTHRVTEDTERRPTEERDRNLGSVPSPLGVGFSLCPLRLCG